MSGLSDIIYDYFESDYDTGPVSLAPILAAVEADSVDTVRNLIPTTSPADLSKALCRSCEKGQLAIAEALLESDQCDPNSTDGGVTALFFAAHNAYPTLVKLLLQHGANVNTKSNRGRDEMTEKQLPLHSVAWCGDQPRRRDGSNLSYRQAVIELLLISGCDINSQDDHGATLLFQCIARSNDLVPFLLRHKAHPNVADSDGRIAMHYFQSPQDKPDLFKLLMEHGARLDLIDKRNGLAPLHNFTSKGYLGDLAFFKPFISDWGILTSKGDTVLHIAVETNRSPTVAALLGLGMKPSQTNHKGQQAIHKVNTSSRRSEEILDILLAAGSDIEAKDHCGQTLLTSTVCNPGHRMMQSQTLVPSLVKRGANINAQDYKGNGILINLIGPLIFQSTNLDNLLRLGADPTMQNYAGQDFLHHLAAGYATIRDDSVFLAMIKLLNNGHCPTRRDFQGRTALHALCSQTSDQLFAASPLKGKCAIDLLLDAGLDAALHMSDHEGVQPIHMAATTSEILVGKLIARGADSTVTTQDGRNLLHIAATARQSNIVGLVLDYYSSIGMASLVNATSDDGRTPLHLACRSGRLETVNLFLDHGANTEAQDCEGYLPIDACSQFLVENQRWIATDNHDNLSNAFSAAGVLADDKHRPRRSDPHPDDRIFNPKLIGWEGEIISEDSTLGSGRVVRALALKGGLPVGRLRNGLGPVLLATCAGDEEMVVAIFRLLRESGIVLERELSVNTECLLLRSRNLPALLKEKFTTPVGRDDDFLQLTLNGHHHELAEALEENAALVRDGSAIPKFLLACARWGYDWLFNRIGNIMSTNEWINGGHREHGGPVIPYLLAAAERQLPNLEVIKVIVEDFNADVNVCFQNGMVSKPRRYHQLSPINLALCYQDGDTVLHRLAQGTHWWYEGAIRYLLQHGANPNARNAEGKTPLFVAVGRWELGGHRQWGIVKILLESGADPNIAATCGFTPLAMSAHNKKIFELLVDHGAVPSRDHPMELFKALSSFDEEMVLALLNMGLDVNNTTLSSAQPHWHAHRLGRVPWSEAGVVRPLHYISLAEFNEPNTREHSIIMVKLLMSNGADPFLPCGTDKLILHELFSDGGIMKPWLDMSDLDLERRDPRGQTLLLSAAKCQFGAHSYSCAAPAFPLRGGNILNQNWKEGDVTRAMALYRKGADLTAIDNFGNTVFHHMAGYQTENEFAVDEYKRTAEAFMEKVPELVKQVNLDGKTPFAIAKEQGVNWAMDMFGVPEE